jgi:membrane protease YdiL (CAAX protease family)
MKGLWLLVEFILVVAMAATLLSMNVNYYLVMFLTIGIMSSREFKRAGNLRDLGIIRSGIWPSIRAQIPFTLVGVAGLLLFAFVMSYDVRTLDIEHIPYLFISVPIQEIIFRGYLQRVLRDLLPRFWNVAAVSVVFSSSHYFTGVKEVYILMAVTLLAGFAWGWFYEKERNLLGPIFSHAVLGPLIFLILPSAGA